MPTLLPIPKKEEGTVTARTIEHYFSNLYSNLALEVLSSGWRDPRAAGTETLAHRENLKDSSHSC